MTLRPLFRTLLLGTAGFFLALAATSCRTDCTPDAVEKAREFALDNLRGITESQRQFVRFTQPEIYENVIFPQYVIPLTEIDHIKSENPARFPTAPHLDRMHSCVVWAPPDLGAKIVVMGDGERSMRLWIPRRVLVKRYLPSDAAFVSALKTCSDHAMNNMLYLSTEERNRVRFSEPEAIVFTHLDMPPAEPEIMPGEETEWDRYLKELNEIRKEYSQISLVWPADKPENKLVFSGWTTTGTLSSWKLQTAELMNGAKLKANTLSKEEIEKIKIAPAALPVEIHPAEKKIDRRSVTDAPDTPVTGGSVIYNR